MCRKLALISELCIIKTIERQQRNGENEMNAIESKLNSMTAAQVFEVLAGLMNNESAEADVAIEAAMNVLETKVGETEFCRLIEQF